MNPNPREELRKAVANAIEVQRTLAAYNKSAAGDGDADAQAEEDAYEAATG